MKKIVSIFAFICAVLALVLSLLPIFIIAYIPAAIGIICALILWKINQKNNSNSTSFKVLVFLLFASLSIISYQVFFTKSEVTDTKKLEQKEQQSEEEAIEELEGLELEE